MAVDIKPIDDEFHIRLNSDVNAVAKVLRTQKSYTQQELAEILGISQKTFSALERNLHNANFSRIHKLMDLLGAEIVIRKKSY
jgi:transcriptional regulator with XRE-family HTH domain